MKIIPEWRLAWKLASVQVLIALQALPLLVGQLSDYAPDGYDRVIFHGSLIIGLVARLLYQPKVREENGNA